MKIMEKIRWILALLLRHMFCENFKEKKKNSICSDLPKIAILPKNVVQAFRRLVLLLWVRLLKWI